MQLFNMIEFAYMPQKVNKMLVDAILASSYLDRK